MTTRKEREEFIAAMALEGVPVDVSRKVLRHAATLQRLAEAQCNGDYPADNGERKVIQCKRCEQSWVPSFIRKSSGLCGDCMAGIWITVALEPYGITPDFSGDPRGAVVKLKLPSGRANSWGGDGFFCVP